MSSAEPMPVSGYAPTLACFELGGQSFGVDVMHVREIVRGQVLTPLPSGPSLIEGVIELRDEMVPVVDLGQALGVDGLESGDAGRIVVVECQELVLGLRVDAATEVLAVDPAFVEAAPDLARRSGYEAVRAVVRRTDVNPVMVLCLENLLESVKRSGDDTPESDPA